MALPVCCESTRQDMWMSAHVCVQWRLKAKGFEAHNHGCPWPAWRCFTARAFDYTRINDLVTSTACSGLLGRIRSEGEGNGKERRSPFPCDWLLIDLKPMMCCARSCVEPISVVSVVVTVWFHSLFSLRKRWCSYVTRNYPLLLIKTDSVHIHWAFSVKRRFTPSPFW